MLCVFVEDEEGEPVSLLYPHLDPSSLSGERNGRNVTQGGVSHSYHREKFKDSEGRGWCMSWKLYSNEQGLIARFARRATSSYSQDRQQTGVAGLD